MYFRQLLNDETACASYLLGCKSRSELAVVDPHVDLVDEYIALAEARASRSSPCIETHVQADHVSGLPELVERTGATAYLPEGAGVEFDHTPSPTARWSKLGNTVIQAIATPGHAAAHHAYLVTDRTRGGRAVDGAHRRRAAGRRRRPAGPARPRRADRRGDGRRALPLADRAAARAARSPAALSGPLLGLGLRTRALGATRPRRSASSAATTRRSQFDSEETFVAALIEDIPPAPEQQAEIVAANRTRAAARRARLT